MEACVRDNQKAGCNSIQHEMSRVSEVFVDIGGCACMQRQSDDEYFAINEVVPSLLQKLGAETDTVALRSLYTMCNSRNRHNRGPLLASRKFNILDALIKRIVREDCEGLELALLILNNLSIPYDNKILIVLGESSSKLFDCLSRIMNKDIPERVLACICLTNLSVIPEVGKPILYHAPIQDWCPELSLLSNPESLIRILERNLTLKSESTPIALSMYKELLRWTCNLVRNLCSCEQNANLMSLSKIPLLTLNLLQKSALPSSAWNVESVEDAALRTLCKLASWSILRITLLEVNAPEIVMGFTGGEDIYDYKSHELLCSLGGQRMEDTWEHKHEEI